MPEYREAIDVPVGFEQALTWVLASATVLKYELHGQVGDTGLQLLADYWVLNDNSIVLDIVLDGRGEGTTNIVVLGRNRGVKLVPRDSIRDKVMKLIGVLRGYNTSFAEGGEVPTTPPPEGPPAD